MELQHKSIEFKLDDVSAAGEISGYGSVFSVLDGGGDVVMPGAFKSSLISGRKVKMLWQHDPSQPIGVWTDVKEDAKGLMVKGKVLPDVAKGAEALSLLRVGAIDGLSIGYRTKDFEYNTSSNGRFRAIKEADLFEVSLVTFPMNEDSLVTNVKNLTSVREVERILRDAGVPGKFATLVANHGFEGATKRLNDHLDDDDLAATQVNDLILKLQRLKETINA